MNTLDNGPRSSFTENAERLEEAARAIKNKHLADVQGVPPQAARTGLTAEESWSKNFMTQGISPRAGVVSASNMTPMPHSTFVMAEFAPPRVARPEEFKRASPIERAPMNMRIGKKEERKRSWLGRLLRGA
jgi:hypothetical protein